jgi:hypothetical protein
MLGDVVLRIAAQSFAVTCLSVLQRVEKGTKLWAPNSVRIAMKTAIKNASVSVEQRVFGDNR